MDMVVDQFNNLRILDPSVILSVQLSELHYPILEGAVDKHGHAEISWALKPLDSYDILPVPRECLGEIGSYCTEQIQVFRQPVWHSSKEEIFPLFCC